MSADDEVYPSRVPIFRDVEKGMKNCFCRKGKKNVGVLKSIKNIYTCSWLNILLLATPVAWWAHFSGEWHDSVAFALCFIAIIPHEILFDYCGEQMKLYLGKDAGELLTSTLNNVVEVTLAIILFQSLKLWQSTITGVVLLHLLLVPGVAFFTGGARIWEQHLHPAHTQLSHSLLTVGVLALFLPAAFYAAIYGTSSITSVANSNSDGEYFEAVRAHFLDISRGLAVILLVIYIGSHIYYHNLPGEGHNMLTCPDVPAGLGNTEDRLAQTEPEVNHWVCITFLISNIGIMAATAEWLVDSIESIKEHTFITQEWFGIVLLPIVSFSADSAIALGYFIKRAPRLLI